MKIHVLLGVLFAIKCITGLDPTLDGDPRRTFPLRRAIDGTRGRKYYEPEVEDAFDIYGATGQYNPYEDDQSGFDDIRSNVPGEPEVDYPAYTRIPQTNFQCQDDYRGYYADEEVGCQLFHVCDSTFLVSSFLCPIGSIFSQKLLTCDWWNKVDCSSTRNYYTVNSQTFSTEVDDDEILRKAYEMTTLQTSPNHVSVSSRDRNAIPGTVHYVNDLQTGPTRYEDYDKIEYKYSSRYNADEINRGLFSSKSSQRNPKIRVHTIGQDQKNDADDYVRDFRPSYAPTVPTVTTTTRRFYSPTVPATTANPGRSRYDLEFESSDHLYSARGKSSSTTLSPVTKPTVDTTTVVVEVPPTLGHSSAPSQPEYSSPRPGSVGNAEIITEKSRIVSEFTMIEFQSLHNGENHTFQIDIDADQNSGKYNTSGFSPVATDISPPFFYYNNGATIDDSSHEEHNATAASNHLIINVPATDIIPPLFKDFLNETRGNSLDIELRPPGVGKIELKPPVVELTNVKSPEVELRPPGQAIDRSNVKTPEIELSPPGFGRIESRPVAVDRNNLKTPEIELSPPGFGRIESRPAAINRSNLKTPEIELSPPGFGRIESRLPEADKTNIKSPADNKPQLGNLNIKPLEVEIKPPQIDVQLPVLDLIPPFLNEVKNFTINVPELSTEDEKNFIRPPARLFLPPYLYYSQGNPVNAIEKSPQGGSSNNETMEEVLDSAGGESSPYQVTLTVKGDEDFNPRGELIKSLIAQQEDSDDIRDVEILKSHKGEATDQHTSHFGAQPSDLTANDGEQYETNPEGRESRSQPPNYVLLQGINSLGIVGRRHPQHIPRPFSVKVQPQGTDRLNSNPRLISDTRLNSRPEINSEPEVSDEFSSELSAEDPKSQVTFNSPGIAHDGPIRFDLPQITRTTTFRSEKELKDFKKTNENRDHKTEKPEITTTQAEVIPSIGFSLNTEEEREEFKEAVLRGLLTDVSISNAKSSTATVKPSVTPKVSSNVNKEKESEDES